MGWLETRGMGLLARLAGRRFSDGWGGERANGGKS